jgi:hypothetical protein
VTSRSGQQSERPWATQRTVVLNASCAHKTALTAVRFGERSPSPLPIIAGKYCKRQPARPTTAQWRHTLRATSNDGNESTTHTPLLRCLVRNCPEVILFTEMNQLAIFIFKALRECTKPAGRTANCYNATKVPRNTQAQRKPTGSKRAALRF